jgi:hypothetical protein
MLEHMATPLTLTTRFGDDECQLAISVLSQTRVLVVLEGRDLGQLGREPFEQLEKTFDSGKPIDLFFDLRHALGATMEVSGSWAVWLRTHGQRLRHVSMLTARPVIDLSAKAVRSFSLLGEKVRLYSDPLAFENALRSAN